MCGHFVAVGVGEHWRRFGLVVRILGILRVGHRLGDYLAMMRLHWPCNKWSVGTVVGKKRPPVRTGGAGLKVNRKSSTVRAVS
jgi:hypothetical protein